MPLRPIAWNSVVCRAILSCAKKGNKINIKQKTMSQPSIYKLLVNSLFITATLLPQASVAANSANDLYWQGVDALSANRIDDAILLFEKTLAINPLHFGAKLDHAITLAKAGRLEEARLELIELKSKDSPQAASYAIDGYIGVINARIAANNKDKSLPQKNYQAYIEAGLGHNGNVSSVSSDFSGGVQQAYGIPNMEPTGNSVVRKSGYLAVNAGISAQKRISEKLSVFGNAGVYSRNYFSAQDFSLGGLNLATGLVTGTLDNVLIAQLSAGVFKQDAALSTQTNDYKTLGGSLEYRHKFLDASRVGLQLSHTSLRYDDVPLQDTNQTVLGVSYDRDLTGSWKPTAGASLFRYWNVAQQNRIDGTNTGSDGWGLRVNGSVEPKDGWKAVVTVIARTRSDDKSFSRSTVVANAKDVSLNLNFGIEKRIDANWSGRAEVQHTNNTSDLNLYQFNRTDVSAWLRYAF